MTLRTSRDFPSRGHLVRVLQQEASGAVIKRAVDPADGVVAGRALGRREARGDVIRNVATERLRAGPGSLVAAVAIRVRSRKRIVVVDVAMGAGNDLACRCELVRTGERPARNAVIKRGVGPSDRIVTSRAVGRSESRARSRVRRVIGGLPGGEVTTGISAIRRLNRQRIVAVDVALRASRHFTGRSQLVRVRQREAGGAVVKFAIGPTDHVVAG